MIARILYRYVSGLDKHWDDKLEVSTIQKFERWLQQLDGMKMVSIPRCVMPQTCNDVQSTQLHFFCDASEEAYAAVCYVRITLRDVSDVDFSSPDDKEQGTGDPPDESQVNAAATDLTATANATDFTPSDKLISH